MTEMTAAEIKKALRNYEIEEISEADVYDRYDDMLDEVHGEFMGYAASRILKEVDPTAYRVGFSDWADSEDDIIEGPDGTYYREL